MLSKTDWARILTVVSVDEHATAAALADAIEAVLPRWIERCVLSRGGSAAATASAVSDAVAEVVPEMRALLAADVDAQWTTPLALLRGAVRYPTAVLRAEGVGVVERDDFSRDRFPDDVYGLTPSSWADVDEALVEVGVAWGAAKAFVHKARHGSSPTSPTST